jgi:hypothetical protein
MIGTDERPLFQKKIDGSTDLRKWQLSMIPFLPSDLPEAARLLPLLQW